ELPAKFKGCGNRSRQSRRVRAAYGLWRYVKTPIRPPAKLSPGERSTPDHWSSPDRLPARRQSLHLGQRTSCRAIGCSRRVGSTSDLSRQVSIIVEPQEGWGAPCDFRFWPEPAVRGSAAERLQLRVNRTL